MGKIDPKKAAAEAKAKKAAALAKSKAAPKGASKEAPKAKPEKEAGTKVALRGSTALTTGDAKSRMLAAAATSKGHGFEQRDLSIPFVVILQAKSLPCVKNSDKYVDGAAEGMIYNNANADLHDGEAGIVFVPTKYTRRWTQWKVRGKEGGGGGFVKDWGQDEKGAMALVSHQDDRGNNIVRDSNPKEQIVESGDYFGFLVDLDTGKADEVIISMTSSNWKSSKRLNSLIQGWQADNGNGGTYNPEMYFRPYLLTTRAESNDSGNWMSWSVQPYKPDDHDEDEPFTTFDLPNGENIVNRAEQFRASIDRGEVKMNFSETSRDSDAAAGKSGEKDEAFE